jgi:anti-sigma B factor antagonist
MIHSVNELENALVISLEGVLEVGSQEKLKEELNHKIPKNNSHIVLDFSRVEFIDSACLGALVAITRTLRKNGGEVTLYGLKDEVQSIFQITRLDKVLKIFERLEDAVKAHAP